MELCSEKHDEVCYEGIRCPACIKIEELELSIERLEYEIKNIDG